jgi:hypothetical protein
VLLIAVCEKPRWRAFLGTLAGFVAVFSLNEAGALSEFLDRIGPTGRTWVDCPSLLALVRDISDRFLGAFASGS